MKKIYVFGHKNPDTDSVCSAIALANLKNKLGMNAVAKVTGQMNRETNFVLDYFKVDAPSYINDVKIQIKDINYTKRAYINENKSILDAFDLMKKLDLTAIALVNDKKNLTGYVSLKGIGKFLISVPDKIETNLELLTSNLEAKIITKFVDDINGNIKAVSFSTDTFIKEQLINNETILVVGDRYNIIEHAIKQKVQLIILTRDRVLPDKLLKLAMKNEVTVISSKFSSFELCNKVALTNYIKTISQTSNPKIVHIHDYYTDFITTAKRYSYSNYPIINDKNECLGILKLSDINNYERKQVILVDHNNYDQSTLGIEEAEILEVFDHHNIGNIGTNIPIYFTCRPVGCTATIIYDCYLKEKVDISYEIGGLLLSAILSDTLLLTSPTTTDIDIKAAHNLASKLKIDINDYGMKMLKSASSIEGLSAMELINQDFKSYTIADELYGIAVITTLDFEQINDNILEYINIVNDMCKTKYKGVLLFIVDIIKQGSYVIYNDNSIYLVQNAFNLSKINEGIFIKNIMSRKKQIIPAIMKELEK